MCRRLCANFHAGTKVQNQNFPILAKIDFSARTTNKIRLKHFTWWFVEINSSPIKLNGKSVIRMH